ncbi:hypothetical protein PCE1_004950 [Barthelona sp. PCE]
MGPRDEYDTQALLHALLNTEADLPPFMDGFMNVTHAESDDISDKIKRLKTLIAELSQEQTKLTNLLGSMSWKEENKTEDICGDPEVERKVILLTLEFSNLEQRKKLLQGTCNDLTEMLQQHNRMFAMNKVNVPE